MLGDRIKQARLLRGLSLRALAEAAGGISAQAISNYETGKDAPGSGVLLRLVDALGVDLEYLFRTVKVELGQPAYRKHCRLSEAEMADLESSVLDSVERYAEAESIVDAEVAPWTGIPAEITTEIQAVEDAEDRADGLRKAWGVGGGPIDCLTELLEDHGIKVIFRSANAMFDGCAYPYGDTPVIVVNERKPTDRIRFDLAHELGHLLIRFPEEWDDKSMEDAAHRFAGAFLVPAKAARLELGLHRTGISILELQKLKLKYGMSMGAWLRRARDLEIVTKSVYDRLYRGIIVRNNWRKQEPFELNVVERSTRMQRLVARAYVDGMVSESRAADLLRMPTEQFLNIVEGHNAVTA